jgi:alcohol dehydrogenase
VCERQQQPGFTHWGSYAEYVTLHHADVNLVAVPDGMAMTTAASLGCRFATAHRAVVAQGGVRPGEWVAVHGCGGVGLSAVMIAVAAGARVVAVDPSPRARELALSLGAQAAVDPAATAPGAAETPVATPETLSTPGGALSDTAPAPSAPATSPSPAGPSAAHATASAGPATASAAHHTAEAVRELTGGGAHLSLDALGSAATCAASVAGLRARGRHVQVGLLPAGGTPVPMDRVLALELQLLGSHGMPAHAYPELMRQVAAGTLRPELLTGSVIGLDEAPAALAALSGGSPAGMTMIAPREASREAARRAPHEAP